MQQEQHRGAVAGDPDQQHRLEAAPGADREHRGQDDDGRDDDLPAVVPGDRLRRLTHRGDQRRPRQQHDDQQDDDEVDGHRTALRQTGDLHRGPVDPYAYLRPDDPEPPSMAGDAGVLLDWVRVVERDAPLRATATARGAILGTLAAGDVARVRAASGAFYRVELPDGGSGFVSVRQVTPAAAPLSTVSLSEFADLRDGPRPGAALVDRLEPATGVVVLGRFGNFQLVRLADARIGWIQVGADAQ